MQREKKEFGKWWIWILVLVIITTITLSILSYVGLIGGTLVKRKVFENSFQYSEARKSEMSAFQAQLDQINIQLSNPELSPGERTNLRAAKAALTVQLQTVRSKLQ